MRTPAAILSFKDNISPKEIVYGVLKLTIHLSSIILSQLHFDFIFLSIITLLQHSLTSLYLL